MLPTGLLDYYDVTGVKGKAAEGVITGSVLEMGLDEKDELPAGYDRADYQSKGFHDAVRVQDFPLRG